MFEILPLYMQSVNLCGSLEDLATHSKLLFKQVGDLVLGKVHIEYVSNDMPQDILNEECKEQITSEQKLVMWIRQFTRDLKI